MQSATNQILVTGTAGWLGQGLVRALIHGLPELDDVWRPPPDLKVRGLVLPGQEVTPPANVSDRLEIVSGDIRNPRHCAEFCSDANGAVLFHAAAVIHPIRVREFSEVNVEGSKNILDAAIAAGVRRAVVVSSNTPCGHNPHAEHRFDENAPYRPYRKYGRSKMLMELAVQERQQAGKIETVTIRCPWFYGPYQPPRQTQFFTMVRDGKMPTVGRGENRRSMVYVDHLIQGLIRAAVTERANGETYWIADGRPYTMNEIFDTVEHLLESEFGQKCVHKRPRLPRIVSHVARVIDWMIQAAGWHHRNIHVLSEMDKTIACTIDKAREQLGYRPLISLEEGMRRSLQWLKDNAGEGGFLR